MQRVPVNGANGARRRISGRCISGLMAVTAVKRAALTRHMQP